MVAARVSRAFGTTRRREIPSYSAQAGTIPARAAAHPRRKASRAPSRPRRNPTTSGATSSTSPFEPNSHASP